MNMWGWVGMFPNWRLSKSVDGGRLDNASRATINHFVKWASRVTIHEGCYTASNLCQGRGGIVSVVWASI